MQDDPYSNLLALDLVLVKKRARRDAAVEALVAGHEDLAVCLGGLAATLDRGGMREDEKYMREARWKVVDKY